MKIKVCGMRDPQNIEQLAQLKPDFMGFIFYRQSPRYVGSLDPQIVRSLPATIKRVGVFVNSTQSDVELAIESYGLDYVQLHGNESPAMCHSLRKKCGVIKAASIATADHLHRATALYDTCVDYLLLDTLTPQYGGSGMAFDWQLLQHYNSATPFFLSGGISPVHSQQIKQLTHPQLFALDLNSRFEIEPGIKDIEQLKIFIDEQN